MTAEAGTLVGHVALCGAGCEQRRVQCSLYLTSGCGLLHPCTHRACKHIEAKTVVRLQDAAAGGGVGSWMFAAARKATGTGQQQQQVICALAHPLLIIADELAYYALFAHTFFAI